MSNKIKNYLSDLKINIAESYNSNVEPSGQLHFTVEPPQALRIKSTMQHSVEFLGKINMQLVQQIKGAVLELSDPGLMSGRVKDGRFFNSSTHTDRQYELHQVDQGHFITWETLASWGNSGNKEEFFSKVMDAVTRGFALDILRVGFNGEKFSEVTDPAANPLGQDVLVGWHQNAKNYNGGRQVVTDPITIGSTGKYKNIDAAVTDIKNNLIDTHYREHPDLVVLVGSDLISDYEYKRASNTAVEKVAIRELGRLVGGMPVYLPPFMPSKRIAVTTLNNLHHYTQENTIYRAVAENQDRKRLENQMLSWQCYELGAFNAIYQSPTIKPRLD